MGHLHRFLLAGAAGQVGDGHSGAVLTPQPGQHAVLGQVLGVGLADAGDVAACLDTQFGRGRTAVHPDHPAVTGGGVLDQIHADAQQLAVLYGQQVGVLLLGVVLGVLVVDAQHIAVGNVVVQGGVVDGVVGVGAHILVDLGQLVVHALLLVHRGNSVVKDLHGHDHGDRKGHRHGDERHRDGHAHGNFLIHGAGVLPSGVVRCNKAAACRCCPPG